MQEVSARSNTPRKAADFISSQDIFKKPFSNKIKQGRLNKVALFQHEYDTLKSDILHKDPSTLTTEEKHKVAMFRIKLNEQMRDFRKKSAPYLGHLIDELGSMRDGLIRIKDCRKGCIDNEEERRKNNAERQQRWRTRRKVKLLGIEIKKKRGRKELDDNAPLPIRKMRDKIKRYNRKQRALRLEGAQQDVSGSTPSDMEITRLEDRLSGGWGSRKPRS